MDMATCVIAVERAAQLRVPFDSVRSISSCSNACQYPSVAAKYGVVVFERLGRTGRTLQSAAIDQPCLLDRPEEVQQAGVVNTP